MHPVLDFYAKNPTSLIGTARRWASRETSDLRALFVLGPPRSGTTLLSRLFLNHSQIYGFQAETNIFSPRPIDNPKRFVHYTGETAYEVARSQSRSLVGFFDQLYRTSFPEAGSEAVFLEKTPQHARYLPYILGRMPRAKAVLAVRDGRDTFCSGRAAENIPQARDIRKHATYYKACLAPLAKKARFADRLHVVRYEDFTRDPETHMQALMEFVGLPLELDRQLTPASEAQDVRAGRKPFKRLSQPITPATVGRWRTEMSQAEIDAFHKIAGAELETLGYPL